MSNEFEQEAGISFNDFLNALGRYFLPSLIVGLLLTALTMSALVFLNWGMKSATTYRATVYFQFSGPEADQYPDGTAFSATDVVAERIIAKAYEKSGLKDFGVEYSDFSEGISVRPYFPTEDELRARYRVQFARRDLSFTERLRLEEELAEVLRTKSQKTAELSLTLNRRFEVPDQKAFNSLRLIVQDWAKDATETLGRFIVSGQVESAELVDLERLKSVSPVTRYLYLRDAVITLDSRMEAIGELPNINSLVTINGISFEGMKRLSQELRTYDLAAIRSAVRQYSFGSDTEFARLVLADRIRNLQSLKAQAQDKVKVLDEEFADYERVFVGSRDINAGNPQLTGDAAVQLSEGLVDRIINLSGAGENSAHLRGIGGRRAEQKFTIAFYDATISDLGDILRGLESSDQEIASTALRERIEATTFMTAETLNKLWSFANELQAASQQAATAFFGEKFTLTFPTDSKVVTRLISPTLFIIAGALLVFLFVGFWVLSAAFVCIRRARI